MNTRVTKEQKHQKILGDLRKVLAEHADHGTLQTCTDASRLHEDLGMDSLDKVEAIMAIEEFFEIEIDVDTDDRFITIGDLIQYIQDEADRE